MTVGKIFIIYIYILHACMLIPCKCDTNYYSHLEKSILSEQYLKCLVIESVLYALAGDPASLSELPI